MRSCVTRSFNRRIVWACSVPQGSGRADYFAIDCTASQLADMTRAEGEGRGNVVLANKH